ncbi:extracellular solute-binding protein [Cohnella fermenti]|uniref:Extracellular solute-binding protein n=1 Tax=Cohnella fermenti TaxID=2565925 RepID=A0A4V3WDX7_9BACL|nr:extracellular solute-binding protein [Cohnella fermenti]THF74004.1 extracellular solute-binding protein [Cohnella fermenti]
MGGRRALRLLALLLLVAVGTAEAACGNSLVLSSSRPSAAQGEDGDKVVLEFWHTYSDLETQVFTEKVLPLFEQAYPNIRIHAVRKDSTDQLKASILATVADNKAPDVMRMDIIWVPEFAKRGALAPLSGMEGFDSLRDQFIGSMLRTALYDGEYYGLPVNATTRAAIFNKNLLQEAGLEEPPTTFDELYDASVRLKSKVSGAYGIGLCCSNGWGSLPYFWTFGGELMDADYTRATGYLDSEASRAALAKLKAWYDEGIIGPSVVGGQPGTWDGVLKGQLLMIDEAHWFQAVNASGENREYLDDIVFSTLPSDVRQGTSVLGGENLVIFGQSTHAKEAWQFIQWMTSEQPQRLMAETGLLPTNNNLHLSAPNTMIATYLEQLAHAEPRPPIPEWTKIEDVFARMVERILTGEQPVEEATRQAAQQIDAIMSVP